jgi:surface polysaccharide O-acyltransferase-like enzyme
VTAIYLLLPLFTYYERRRRYLTIIAAIYLLLPLFTYYESRHRYLTILRGVAAICLLPSQCDRYLPIMALFDYFEVDLPLYGIYPFILSTSLRIRICPPRVQCTVAYKKLDS